MGILEYTGNPADWLKWLANSPFNFHLDFTDTQWDIDITEEDKTRLYETVRKIFAELGYEQTWAIYSAEMDK